MLFLTKLLIIIVITCTYTRECDASASSTVEFRPAIRRQMTACQNNGGAQVSLPRYQPSQNTYAWKWFRNHSGDGGPENTNHGVWRLTGLRWKCIHNHAIPKHSQKLKQKLVLHVLTPLHWHVHIIQHAAATKNMWTHTKKKNYVTKKNIATGFGCLKWLWAYKRIIQPLHLLWPSSGIKGQTGMHTDHNFSYTNKIRACCLT